MFADIESLEDQLSAANNEVNALITGLTPQQGVWRPAPDSWSISECFDHLAVTNRVYLAAMEPAALNARVEGKMRKGPAVPGFFGRRFVSLLEPPVKRGFKIRTTPNIRPRTSPPIADAVAAFQASQKQVLVFLQANSDIDLAGVTFPNPIIKSIRFSLATGLHNILAHERRHLWQAQRVRESIPDAH